MSLVNLFVVTVFVVAASSAPATKAREWWETVSIYQVYPRSFKDSNNDGIGDLRGIIDKLDYFKETGIGAVWLSPIYPSPMVDFGYDISDFVNVAPEYGTLDDFDDLVAGAHERDIKIIMDFVPNHSSDKHEWFEKSVNRVAPYEDYYVWRDAKGVDEEGNPIPPNNWLSVFYGSAWEYNPVRQQFYLHQFAKGQPDLNYRNPVVVEDMKNVIRFWLKRGVDGFRIDAIPHLFEDVRELDEPLAYPEFEDPQDFAHLNHIYVTNQDETYDMVQQWREVSDAIEAEDGEPRCLMVEAYTTIELTMKFYGTEERPGAHFPFNFQFISANSNYKALDFKRTVDVWMDNMPSGRRANWVIGNHDNHRVANRLGADLKDGMNMLVTLLPGISVTYYGEEIGMEDNTDITFSQGQDPQGCNYPEEQFTAKSRDFERTPFQWDATVNAGFNDGADPWLPVNKNYTTLNLAAQVGHSTSHYEIYRDLQKARGTRTIQEGNFIMNTLGDNTVGFIRGLGSNDFFVVLINLSYSDEDLNLDKAFFIGSSKSLYVYTASLSSGLEKGSQVSSSSILLKARGSVVLTAKQV